jgi:hypothetical protein
MENRDRQETRSDDGNPLREEQRDGIRAELSARLRHRRVELTGAESDEELLAITNAVEGFESAVSALGGDLFVDTPESSLPEHGRFVLPLRQGAEAADAYAARVRRATERLQQAD